MPPTYAVAVEVQGRVTVHVEAETEMEAGELAREQIRDSLPAEVAHQLTLITDYGDAFDLIAAP